MSRYQPPYPETTRREILKALKAINCMSVQSVAQAYGVSHDTIRRWASRAGLPLPDAETRIAEGGRTGSARRWPNVEKRRRRAQTLRGRGKTYAEIAAAVGYRSQAGVHYSMAKVS